MRCSICGAENPEGLKFCNECAAPFKRPCAQCGFDNALTARFCGQCAAPLSAAQRLEPLAEPPQPVHIATQADSQAIEGERKTVTALFADLKGSTELMLEMDPEDARAIVDPALKIMIDAVHRYDGYVVQSTGDGIFALFGAPTAHEDHPQHALYAALKMQEQLRIYGERLIAGREIDLRARVGVNTGEVVVRAIHTGESNIEYTPIGHTANLASRLQTVAAPGSVVVTDHTRHLVEEYFEFKPLGPKSIKGVTEPVEVHEVVGLGRLRTRLEAAIQRGLTKFVARGRELGELERALARVRAGHGQLVGVVGDPGIGKSRLLHEFKTAACQGCTVLEAFAPEHGKAAGHMTVFQLAKHFFAITPEDRESEYRDKIRNRIQTLDPTLESTLPYMFAALGVSESPDPIGQMDPDIRHRRILESSKRLILCASLVRPLILIIEDLHWIDRYSEEFLNVMADAIANARVMLLVAYRPGYRHNWETRTYYTRLGLDPLSDPGASAMVDALIGGGEELGGLKRLVIDKTDGNPLFVEELVQELFDEQVLTRTGDEVRVARPIGLIRIPTTVQGILAGRIDRLPAAEKELLQTLAVIGRDFSLNLIQAVTHHSETELERMLAHLCVGEFIYEQPATETRYVFKHALTQEVAYNSLLLERRRATHEGVAAAIENLWRERLNEMAGDLANHYSRAGNVPKAVRYSIRAGQQAMRQSAYPAAMGYLKGGLELIRNLREGAEYAEHELQLQLALGRCFTALKGSSPEVEDTYLRALHLCSMLGETPHLFPVLLGLRVCYLNQGRLAAARTLGEQLLTSAERMREPAMLVAAHTSLGQALVWTGEFAQAQNHLEEALRLHDAAPQSRTLRVENRIACLGTSSLALWFLGLSDQAAKRSEAALTEARAVGRPGAIVEALVFASQVDHYRRDSRRALERAEAAIALATEHGFSLWLAQAVFQHGWAMASLGQVEGGIADMRRGIARLEAIGTSVGTWQFAAMSEAHMKMGAAEIGLGLVSDGLARLARTGECTYEAELHRLMGEILMLRTDDTGRAEQSFRSAIAAARRQQAKSLELRASKSLAQLLNKHSRGDEARIMLADIYGRFTEGFDTADLKDAEALLEQLNR